MQKSVTKVPEYEEKLVTNFQTIILKCREKLSDDRLLVAKNLQLACQNKHKVQSIVLYPWSHLTFVIVPKKSIERSGTDND